MKKIVSILLSLVLVLGLSVTAMANSNTTLNDDILENGELTISPKTQTITLGESATLTATTTAPGGSSFYLVNDSWSCSTPVELSGSITGSGSNVLISSVTFTPASVGTYTFTYNIVVSHNPNAIDNPNDNSNIYGTVTATVIVEPSLTEYPAAPAIANAYLKSLGIKPNSTASKNIISQVAQRMLPRAAFPALNGTDSINRWEPGYADAVKAYVDQIR